VELSQAKHGSKADVHPFHDGAPFVAPPGRNDPREFRLQVGPAAASRLIGEGRNCDFLKKHGI
jgi:hypothetical protein